MENRRHAGASSPPTTPTIGNDHIKTRPSPSSATTTPTSTSKKLKPRKKLTRLPLRDITNVYKVGLESPLRLVEEGALYPFGTSPYTTIGPSSPQFP